MVQCSKREESRDRKQQATSFGLYLDNTKQLCQLHLLNAIFDERVTAAEPVRGVQAVNMSET